MYQVRITDADGSNPIVLDKADNISYNKVISSVNESISFNLPTSDSKSSLIDETKLWELWDTVANVRKNRGPIHGIDDSDGGTLKISGPGRSQFLGDHVQQNKIEFYTPIHETIDGLRYENVAASPATKTYVWDGTAAKKSLFFDGVTIDENQYMQFYGLSKQTKDNIIDDNTGYILPGTDKPKNTFFTTDSYWAGTNKADSIIIDLGDSYDITKTKILFPWWGGAARLQDRGFVFKFSYATNVGDFDTLTDTDWVTLYNYTEGRVVAATWYFYFSAGSNFSTSIYTGAAIPPVRYFRVLITDVKAWFGSVYDNLAPQNYWAWQCDPNASAQQVNPGGSVLQPIMKDKKINDKTLEPANDCYASIVEFGAYETIIEENEITSLVKQRIKSDNRQIGYVHTADASETITVDAYRKYEPGSYFKRAEFSWSGAGSSFTKFYDKDCAGCYAAFNFGIMDDLGSLIYHSTSSSGSNVPINLPRFASSFTMKGAADATVNEISAWQSKIDPLSWGGFYAYSEKVGDNFTIGFRGASFQWWATVPSGKTGASVLIKIRERNDTTGNWSAYTTLETGYIIPDNITSEVVYDIPYGTTLTTDKSYEIYVENLDGNYASVDSFGGWWSGSMVEYNEDSDRAVLGNPDFWKQIYDNRFSSGSIYKTNAFGNTFAFLMEGDRVQIYSALGRNHGKLSIYMSRIATGLPQYDPVNDLRVFIPGGSGVDGSRTYDLGTGKKGNEIPGVLLFDSDTLSGWKFGVGGSTMDSLPWGMYYVVAQYAQVEKYLADPSVEDSDQFVHRCQDSDCDPTVAGTESINKFIFIDGFATHEVARISGSWKIQKNSDVLASIAEAFELEWDIGEAGLTVTPRLGDDTDIILLEGVDTVIQSEIIKDGSKMATQLISSGADIDGLPLFTVVEDRKNRKLMGRTIQQIQDYRDLADYFTLIGVSRAELIRRREPEYRIMATHIGYKYGLEVGDSLIIKKRAQVPIRARINSLTINQSKSSGTTYELECEKWPPII